jgi:hypothetical protein
VGPFVDPPSEGFCDPLLSHAVAPRDRVAPSGP